MSTGSQTGLLLVLDDRELAADPVRSMVGERRFGDMVFRRKRVADHFRHSLPGWARTSLVHLRSAEDLPALRAQIQASGPEAALFVCAGRAGFPDPGRLAQLVERLPYAEQDFTDRLYKPLLVYLRNAHRLIDDWAAFEAQPLHLAERPWSESLRVESVLPLDLGQLRDFLTFISGSTATRHFNQVAVDAYYYTKSSTDKRKMRAEYAFYGLVPEAMRPWLIQPFDFVDTGDRASYKMMRYYLADAALQWVHGAFDARTFAALVDRLLFFIAQRPARNCARNAGAAIAEDLFVDKVQKRVRDFLALSEGQRINALARSASPALDVEQQLERYLGLYRRHGKAFATDKLVVGHGDPCFSNILYEQQHYLLKLIDPKGAITEDELWTHPLYDLCKISHSVLGDYDFINNGLYTVGFTERNDLLLRLTAGNQAALKPLFTERVQEMGYDPRVIRLGEASLFLSMLPLHIDHPNKVIAFMLIARQILDEVEHD